ncbi:MAG: M56 family metallopeptidase [Rhodothermales bacterium]
MIPIADWLQALGTAGLDLFWRPLLVWTLVCLPLYAGLRCWRSAPPLVKYHAHLALLLALPLSLMLAPFLSFPAPQAVAFIGEVLPLPALEAGSVAAPAVGQAAPDGVAWEWAHGLGVVTLLALGGAVFLLIRMVYLAHELRAYRHGLSPVDEAHVYDVLHPLANEMGVRIKVTLLVAPEETTPMTFGWLHPVIVLPAALLHDASALRLTLIHELIHVRRRDYAISWVVRLIGSLFVIHPGVWLLRRHIDQYREISCDAEALADRQISTRQYARLLLRFSPLTDFAGPTALRMVELDSTLKQRINAMNTAVRFSPSPRLRRLSLPLAALLLLALTLFAACANKTTTTSETVIVNADATDEALHEKEALLEAELAAVAEQRLLEEKMAVLEAERKYSARELRALELQMAYLREEIKKTSKIMDDLPRGIEDLQGQVTGSEYGLARQRLHLLNAMYSQRLERFETMKMEQFTQAALHEMGSE